MTIQSTTDDLIAEIELDFQSARKLGREAYIDMQDGEALIARIRELDQADRWRDIDEEMPEEDVRVLVWCDDGADAWPDTASHHNSFFTDEYHELLPVTHWKPVTPP